MKKVLFSLLFILFAAPVIAGGPFFVDRGGNGTPTLWANNNVGWMADPGPLSAAVDNAKAVGWIQELFRIWRGAALSNAGGTPINVANLKSTYYGFAGEDVTVSNYLSVIDAAYDKGLAVVIFDTDGSIVDAELGTNSKKYVVGFSSPVANGGAYFGGGVVVLNGLFVDGDKKASGEVGEEEFKAAVLHELGHLLNLDHTQANIEALERAREGDLSLMDEIPTMFPILYSKDQLTLHTDDVISLAEQYPSQEYKDNFCTITGELKDTNGEGFQGADVVARSLEADSEWSDVRTVVSGVFYPEGTLNGSYVLGGLIPERRYVIGYRGVDEMFTGGSNVAPFDPPKSSIVPGVINADVVACEAGGKAAQMGEAKVDDPGAAATASGSTESNFDSTAPSGGCSLIPR